MPSASVCKSSTARTMRRDGTVRAPSTAAAYRGAKASLRSTSRRCRLGITQPWYGAPAAVARVWGWMAFPREKRVQQLRLLARRVERTPLSSQRDELLFRTRLRIVEIEAREELDTPSPIRGRPAT
jgi:hypothetical protein